MCVTSCETLHFLSIVESKAQSHQKKGVDALWGGVGKPVVQLEQRWSFFAESAVLGLVYKGNMESLLIHAAVLIDPKGTPD